MGRDLRFAPTNNQTVLSRKLMFRQNKHLLHKLSIYNGFETDGRDGISSNLSHSGYKVFSISSIIDDLAFFNTSQNYMMQRSKNIKAGLSGHLVSPYKKSYRYT